MISDDFRHWQDRARDAAARLPGLPSFAEVVAGDRERWFRELGYTFWNGELLDALAARLRAAGPPEWLELAAGTGRLAAEFSRRGVPVAATDDYSQAEGRVRSFQRPLRYGEWVAPLEARAAVALFRPRGVLCAWPPLGSGLVPDLLERRLPGGEALEVLVCLGEPGGATEAPAAPWELPPGWRLERWPECEPWLFGFNDPPPGQGLRGGSALLVYRAA